MASPAPTIGRYVIAKGGRRAMRKFAVSMYYRSSETTYTFGPMTEFQVDKFLKDRVEPNLDKFESIHVEELNPIELQGTGSEVALDLSAQWPFA